MRRLPDDSPASYNPVHAHSSYSTSHAFQLFSNVRLTCFLDPFAEVDDDTGDTKQSQNYIHIRIQRKLGVSFYRITRTDSLRRTQWS